MKEIIWNERAKTFVRNLDEEMRREVGSLLLVLQRGEILGYPQSRSMSSIHKDARELRVKGKSGLYRIIYVLIQEGKIIVPHAFKKKSQKTPKKEIDLSRSRLKEILNEIE